MKSDYKFLTTEINGHVLEVTINRPDVMNSLHPPSHQEFDEVWNEFGKDENLWVGIVTGTGDRAFSAGNDLKYQASGGDRSGMPSSGFAGLTSRFDLTKPLIAAVNGVAMGGGMEIALACDLIVMSEKASLIEVFVNIGLVLDTGSSYFLPRLVGSAKAFELASMGSKVGAEEALKLNMVNKVCAHDDLDETVKQYTDYYKYAPTKAIGLIKGMLKVSLNSNLKQMLDEESRCQEIAANSEDYTEGLNAFLEKRPAKFKGI